VVERIRRMKADDPNVPARIEKAMNDLQARARLLRMDLEDTQKQWLQLDEMRRAYLARRQKEVDPRTVPALLEEILHRLGRIERRLDQLELRGGEPAFWKK
jgi:hypothetical protein